MTKTGEEGIATDSRDSLISVIVPVYRAERFLDRCVESIVNQTHQNLEIILVDDGSPDSSPEICDRWAERDARVTVIHQENRGVSAARNVGVAAATGTYIGFIDNDDFVHPDYFQTLYTLLVGNHAEMSVCMHSVVDEDGFVIPRFLQQHSLPPGVYTGRELLKQGFVFTVWGTLLTAGLCRKETFPEDRSSGEDFYYISHLIVDCGVIAVTNKKLYRYTRHSESAMGRLRQCADENGLAQQISLAVALYQLFLSRDLPETASRMMYSGYFTILELSRYGNYFRNHNYRVINRQMRSLISETIRLKKAGSFRFILNAFANYLKRHVFPDIKSRWAWRWRAVKRRFLKK